MKKIIICALTLGSISRFANIPLTPQLEAVLKSKAVSKVLQSDPGKIVGLSLEENGVYRVKYVKPNLLHCSFRV